MVLFVIISSTAILVKQSTETTLTRGMGKDILVLCSLEDFYPSDRGGVAVSRGIHGKTKSVTDEAE